MNTSLTEADVQDNLLLRRLLREDVLENGDGGEVVGAEASLALAVAALQLGAQKTRLEREADLLLVGNPFRGLRQTEGDPRVHLRLREVSSQGEAVQRPGGKNNFFLRQISRNRATCALNKQ